MTRQEVFGRIRAVEAEHRVAALAVQELRLVVDQVPSFLLERDLQPADLERCGRNLERTFVIRIYAEFEASLRDFWQAPRGMRRRSEPPALALLDSIGARRGVDPDTLRDAHFVREYRNALVHTGAPAVPRSLRECRSFLYRFVSYLPPDW